MVQIWKSQPEGQVIVTHSATPYTLDYTSVTVRRHENGFDTGTVVLEDTQAKNYVDKVVADDLIEIKQRDKSESWATILKGVIRRVEPILLMQGNFLKVECDGAGYGLDATVCGEEYGTESSNATLDTIKEIVEDGSKGIIPLWVNKVLGQSGVDSGFSYTTQVETITGSIPYLYFPYKPPSKAINDICNVVQAIKGTNAGPHWIVDTESRVLIATIGNHGSPASTYWPTWWRTNEAGSTLEEGKDFLNFRFQQLAKRANYVLYHGHFKRPIDGDKWTENNSGEWGVGGVVTVTDEATIVKKGSYSIEGNSIDSVGGWFFYPSSQDAAWDFTKWGGRFNHPTINYYAHIECDEGDAGATGPYFFTSGANYYSCAYNAEQHGGTPNSTDIWKNFQLEIGPNANKKYNEVGSPDWSDIDYVGWKVVKEGSSRTYLYIDNLYFDGWVLRGARPTAAFSSTNRLKLKVITDNIAKDDSLVASDDSGLMGRLCYTEYLRLNTTPIVGTFTSPMINDMLPGQKIHLHAKKKADGSFRINDDFRVTRLVHTINEQGFLTQVDVTDDLKNANPRPMPTQLNMLLGAVRPEFQDRQATSIKTREIDVAQTILEKTY